MSSRRQRDRFRIGQTSFEAVVTDDGSCTLYSPEYDQTFHSESGALSESRLVFLENSGVKDRLMQGFATRVLEIGFGTGLNFALSATVALGMNCELHYCAIDRAYLPWEVLKGLQRTSCSETKKGFDWLDECYRSIESLALNQTKRVSRDNIEFQAVRANASTWQFPRSMFHAIYLDAFSPESNPELWTQEFFQQLSHLLERDGRLVTYCVKSKIQRDIMATGLEVKKTPGPKDGKREVLMAIKTIA